ncbi:DUF2835 domain-containing protein [Idiomarina tyrosinivorans]|uniref:DUF2835 domain-containing protein n=1 Tax=Idiomarina tyrosinivorans TaxID=1445662 RepID=A0A432ZTN4_9GAMM|nr:DUF2835 family protein [Idiomarina tyrosinivorans]RUO81294.1 DUF2835 domain-containing protein [Idiomarina tyrosinivorans]
MQVTYYFNLSMSYQTFIDVYYSGKAQSLMVTSDNGTRLSIPAGRFIPLVNAAGLNGRFKLVVDEKAKFQSLEQIHSA